MSYSPFSLEFRGKIQTRDSSILHCSAICSEVHIIVTLQRFGFKGCYQAQVMHICSKFTVKPAVSLGTKILFIYLHRSVWATLHYIAGRARATLHYIAGRAQATLHYIAERAHMINSRNGPWPKANAKGTFPVPQQ